MAIYGIPEPHVAAPTLTAPETGTEVPSDSPTLVAPTAPEAK
jgi:hypothetical protein